jgi:hypothetical protein
MATAVAGSQAGRLPWVDDHRVGPRRARASELAPVDALRPGVPLPHCPGPWLEDDGLAVDQARGHRQHCQGGGDLREAVREVGAFLVSSWRRAGGNAR